MSGLLRSVRDLFEKPKPSRKSREAFLPPWKQPAPKHRVALESRMMFDGAALATVADVTHHNAAYDMTHPSDPSMASLAVAKYLTDFPAPAPAPEPAPTQAAPHQILFVDPTVVEPLGVWVVANVLRGAGIGHMD